MINTDYSQYLALREREAYFKEMVNVGLTDRETQANNKNLEDLQKDNVNDK